MCVYARVCRCFLPLIFCYPPLYLSLPFVWKYPTKLLSFRGPARLSGTATFSFLSAAAVPPLRKISSGAHKLPLYKTNPPKYW